MSGQSLYDLPALKIASPISPFSEETLNSLFTKHATALLSPMEKAQVSEVSEVLECIRVELNALNLASSFKFASGQSINKIARCIQELRHQAALDGVQKEVIRKFIDLRFDPAISVLLSILTFNTTGDLCASFDDIQVEQSPRTMTPSSFGKYFGEKIETISEFSVLSNEFEKMRQVSFEIKNCVGQIFAMNELSNARSQFERLLSLLSSIQDGVMLSGE